MTGFNDHNQEWFDAHVHGPLIALAHKEGAELEEHNPKLVFIAKKFCTYDHRDPEHVIFSCPSAQMPVDAKGHASFTYMPRPMMAWMAYLQEAGHALTALEEWDNRSVEEQITQ